MANFIEVQSSNQVAFTTDTNLVASPILILCNRQYDVVDFSVNVVVSNSDNNNAGSTNTTRLTIDSVTAAGVVTPLGTVITSLTNPVAASTWRRPVTSTIAAAAATVTDALVASATVPRGNLFRISAAANGTGDATVVRAQGSVRILPGNRYSAANSSSAYYANNSASGAQGSSATQSI
jgi:hypothetical protein